LLNVDPDSIAGMKHNPVAFEQRVMGGPTTLNFTGYDERGVQGVEYAALWSVKDMPIIKKYYTLLRVYRRASRSLYKWNFLKAMRFEAMYTRLMDDFQRAFNGFHNDQRNQKWWNGVRFEPHEVIVQDNHVPWQGMAHFIKLGAGISSEYFDFMGIGKATGAPVTIPNNKQSLYDQVARESASATGAITSDGNTYRMSAAFATTVSSATIKEYGGFNKRSGGIMLFIAISPKGLKHVQGDTIIQSTHHIIFTSRSV
jgi:hypothetical protein